MAEAIQEHNGLDLATAKDIAFHLVDWRSDAAFLVALLLFPERFTAEEIDDGVAGFLIHCPNHVAAAAKLYGYPVQDTFDLGALDGDPENDQPGESLNE